MLAAMTTANHRHERIESAAERAINEILLRELDGQELISLRRSVRIRRHALRQRRIRIRRRAIRGVITCCHAVACCYSSELSRRGRRRKEFLPGLVWLRWMDSKWRALLNKDLRRDL